MKLVLTLFTLVFALQSNAQKDWTEATASTYSIKHPETWKSAEAESPDEMTLIGPTPDFDEQSEYIGTTLYISAEESKYGTIEAVAAAYKLKLLGSEFLKNISFKKERKFTFKGVDAVEIIFTGKVQHFSTGCRILLFQKNGIYYELSVTSDLELSKKLLKEAYKVMDTFEFID